jgi:hypothetical protein
MIICIEIIGFLFSHFSRTLAVLAVVSSLFFEREQPNG